MTPTEPTREDAARVIEALRAPSFRQDSQWHVAPFNYATKPRALLDAAADALALTQARVAQVEAERDRLREALEPFAKFAVTMAKMGGNFPRSGPYIGLQTGSPEEVEVTVEDFTRARAALQPPAPQPKGD